MVSSTLFYLPSVTFFLSQFVRLMAAAISLEDWPEIRYAEVQDF